MSKITQGDAEMVFALRMLMVKYNLSMGDVCRILTIIDKEK